MFNKKNKKNLNSKKAMSVKKEDHSDTNLNQDNKYYEEKKTYDYNSNNYENNDFDAYKYEQNLQNNNISLNNSESFNENNNQEQQFVNFNQNYDNSNENNFSQQDNFVIFENNETIDDTSDLVNNEAKADLDSYNQRVAYYKNSAKTKEDQNNKNLSKIKIEDKEDKIVLEEKINLPTNKTNKNNNSPSQIKQDIQKIMNALESITNKIVDINKKVNWSHEITSKNSEIISNLIGININISQEIEDSKIILDTLEDKFISSPISPNNSFLEEINENMQAIKLELKKINSFSFESEIDKISILIIKNLSREFDKLQQKYLINLDKITNSFNSSFEATFSKITSIVRENKKTNELLSQKLSNQLNDLQTQLLNNKINEYDEYSLSETDIRVLKWLLAKEYAKKDEAIQNKEVFASLTTLTNLNIISLDWREDIDELPVIVYWVSKEKSDRVRNILGRWEYNNMGTKITDTLIKEKQISQTLKKPTKDLKNIKSI